MLRVISAISDCGVRGVQITNMLFGFGAFVLAIGSTHCAVRRYKSFDLQSIPSSLVEIQQPVTSNLIELPKFNWQPATYFIRLNPLDLQPEASDAAWNLQKQSPNLVLDQQPEASNIIEVDQLDPRNQPVSSSFSLVETSGNSASGRKGSARRSKSLFSTATDDDGDDAEGEKGTKQKGEDNAGRSRTKEKEKERTRTAQQQVKSTKALRQKQPPPKSINEVIEGKPLLGASSSSKLPKKLDNDLKKSGSYLSGSLGDGFEEGYDKEKHFDNEGGKKYVEAHKSEAGEKAQQGYKKEEGFDKAEDEKHGKEEKKAIVSEKRGEKKGHVEQEKQFGEEYKGNQGEKGISVTKKGGHKKGSKKTGFHKVHHKDEYKKDEVFYDESHDGDEHEEHAHEQEKHSKEKGGTAKKALLDSQYHEGHGEKKGIQDKGHSYEEASGHKKEAGQEAHSDKKSEYGKKGGVKEGKKYGHAEGGVSGAGYSDHDFF